MTDPEQEKEKAATAATVMQGDPVVLLETATLAELTAGLGRSAVGSVLIADAHGKLTGIFTERDLVHALARGTAARQQAKALMHRDPAVVSPETSLASCAAIMEERQCRHLPVVAAGKPVGTVTVLGTQAALITELSASLGRLSEVTQKLALRDEYLGIVAHDVRSPLGIIESCCLFLKDELAAEGENSPVSAMVETMHQSATSGIRLVEELLDVGRLDSGAKLRCAVGSLSDLVNDAVKSLGTVAAQKHQRLRAVVEADVQATFDGQRLVQALDNLINNALKFSPEGRGVTVRLEFVGTSARIAVQDEGPGIPVDKIARLFRKHERLDADVVGTKGFGLGLAIAHQFVALHKGKIEVDGGGPQPHAPGLARGATFTIVLPGAARRSSAPPASLRTRVMVVDDDKDVRHYLMTALRRGGFDVHPVPDGPQGLADLYTYAPDLVITDARMPGLDGFTLVRRLKQLRPDLPVILLSGYFPTLDEGKAADLFRADRYLAKPVELDQLLDAVRGCLPARAC